MHRAFQASARLELPGSQGAEPGRPLSGCTEQALSRRGGGGSGFLQVPASLPLGTQIALVVRVDGTVKGHVGDELDAFGI